MSRTRPRPTKRLSGPISDSTPRLLFQKELRSTTPRSRKTSYNPFLSANDDFVVHGRSVERSLWTRDRAPFRFLELPQELQDAILTYHYQLVEGLCIEGYCLVCAGERTIRRRSHRCVQQYNSRIKGQLPSLAIERACHKLLNDSRAIRDKVWPRNLTFDEKIHVQSLMKDFATQNRWKWLRDRMTSVVFKEVSSYALSQKIGWAAFSVMCPGIKNFSIHHRQRKGYVSWRPDQCAAQANREDPDSENLASLNSDLLRQVAAALQSMHGDEFVVKVVSAVWWSLMHTARQSCFEKTITYSFRHDGHKITSKKYEIKELEDLRVAETRLRDDWSP